RVSASVAAPRFYALLLGLFAALAVLLAAVGIYGVLSYNVSQRHREIGVRMALGAKGWDILALVLRQGLLLTLNGGAIGLVAAAASARLLTTLLFGVTPTDPATYAGISAVLVLVAAFACWIPARRDPRRSDDSAQIRITTEARDPSRASVVRLANARRLLALRRQHLVEVLEVRQLGGVPAASADIQDLEDDLNGLTRSLVGHGRMVADGTERDSQLGMIELILLPPDPLIRERLQERNERGFLDVGQSQRLDLRIEVAVVRTELRGVARVEAAPVAAAVVE